MNSRPLFPTSTLLIKIVEALLSSEDEPEKEIVERVNWIYNNTHEHIKKHLSIVEFAVFKNLDTSKLNREIELGNKNYMIVQLYTYLNEIEKELTKIVIQIAKKYSIDMPLMSMGSSKDSEVRI